MTYTVLTLNPSIILAHRTVLLLHNEWLLLNMFYVSMDLRKSGYVSIVYTLWLTTTELLLLLWGPRLQLCNQLLWRPLPLLNNWSRSTVEY
jgi:hypothetical protein